SRSLFSSCSSPPLPSLLSSTMRQSTSTLMPSLQPDRSGPGVNTFRLSSAGRDGCRERSQSETRHQIPPCNRGGESEERRIQTLWK
ncbi:hypothetical protein PENTCL1PPCAC_28163, partial [Pristionchus entomophagus]